MQSGPLNASLDMLFSTLESRLRESPNFRGSPSRESKKTSENKTRGTLGVHLVLRFLRGALDPCFFSTRAADFAERKNCWSNQRVIICL